ncbi:MAG: hypothetical protein ACO3QC_05400, partial [Phycisphaerales bacterium]
MATIVGACASAAGLNASRRLSCDTLTNARSGLPAKTTSQGSSPVSSVAFSDIDARSTIDTVSETWFTTHASPEVRARPETGSSPTALEP